MCQSKAEGGPPMPLKRRPAHKQRSGGGRWIWVAGTVYRSGPGGRGSGALIARPRPGRWSRTMPPPRADAAGRPSGVWPPRQSELRQVRSPHRLRERGLPGRFLGGDNSGRVVRPQGPGTLQRRCLQQVAPNWNCERCPGSGEYSSTHGPRPANADLLLLDMLGLFKRRWLAAARRWHGWSQIPHGGG